MTVLWSNNASTSIAGSITATDTTVALAAGTGIEFPNPTGGDYYVATFYDQATKTRNEIVHVTAMSGDHATIVRAQEGTTAQAWNAGDIFANLITAGTMRIFQQGTAPTPTTIVYTALDTGPANTIIATTVPTFSTLVVGMQINVKVNNGNTGPTTAQFNGMPAQNVTRNNGAALIGGDITATEEVVLIWNGTNFNTQLPNLPQHPPVTTFYVRTDGNDSNTGWYNTSTDAFATVQGAINAIKTRYSSQSTITIRVADGSYTGGFTDSDTYIAAWDIIGNTSNPGNVIIDATSAGSSEGFGALAQGTAHMTVQGMSFRSHYSNCAASEVGSLTVIGCNFTSNQSSASGVLSTYGSGDLFVWGNCQYSSTGYNATCLFESEGGLTHLGYHSDFVSQPMIMTIVGAVTFTVGTAVATTGGKVDLDSAGGSTVSGTVTGHQWLANLGGGVGNTAGATGVWPGNQPGTTVSPGWSNP